MACPRRDGFGHRCAPMDTDVCLHAPCNVRDTRAACDKMPAFPVPFCMSAPRPGKFPLTFSVHGRICLQRAVQHLVFSTAARIRAREKRKDADFRSIGRPFPLVSKMHLGTHVRAKRGFAASGIPKRSLGRRGGSGVLRCGLGTSSYTDQGAR
jgi:hypothetical protein